MLTVFLAALLSAQQPDCTNPVTQSAMNYCEGARAQREDVALNVAWRQLIALVRASDRQNETRGEGERRYRAAQRAWIAWRDGHCEVEGLGALGGSMESMLVSGCLATMTRDRTAQLRAAMAEWQGR